jgi:hypothetical protein
MRIDLISFLSTIQTFCTQSSKAMTRAGAPSQPANLRGRAIKVTLLASTPMGLDGHTQINDMHVTASLLQSTQQ